MTNVYHSTARSNGLEEITKPKVGSWISLVEPKDSDLLALAKQLNLDEGLLNDALDIYEAPRIEHDEGNVYIYTRYCHPEGSEIATEPLLIVYTPDHLVTIMRGNFGVLNRLTSGYIDVTTTQKTKTLLQILAEINSSYRTQLLKASKKTLQTRARIRQNELSRREFVGIIELEEDLNEFLTALQPQSTVLNTLLN